MSARSYAGDSDAFQGLSRPTTGTFGPAGVPLDPAMILFMAVDGAGAEVLDREECFRLLAGGGLGRVAISVAALPTILPVRYVVDRGEIVFRAGGGTVLESASRGTVLAFETDGVDVGGGPWSVVVTGLARHVIEQAELARAAALPLRQWSSTGPDHLIAVNPAVVSGRRLPAETD